MAIKNYTTSIDVFKTVGEIQSSLAKSEASQIGVDYEGGQPVSVSFMLSVKGTEMLFRLPSNHDGVLRSLKSATGRNVTAKHRTPEQAKRVAWRIVKDWLEAQLAIIEAEVAQAEQVFLPYAVAKDGRTLFQHFEASPRLMLSQGVK